MKRFLALLAISVTFGLGAGCTTANSHTGGAILFSYFREPVSATGLAGSSKQGSACSYNVLGLFSGGDASIAHAKADSGITKVSTVDRRSMEILMFLFGMNCTEITGE